MDALSHAFKFINYPVHEVCFSNNNMTDEAFADFLTTCMNDDKLNLDLKKITYADNNDLGTKTLFALSKLIKNKFEM